MIVFVMLFCTSGDSLLLKYLYNGSYEPNIDYFGALLQGSYTVFFSSWPTKEPKERPGFHVLETPLLKATICLFVKGVYRLTGPNFWHEF